MTTLATQIADFKQIVATTSVPIHNGLVHHRWPLIDSAAEIYGHYSRSGLDRLAHSLHYNRTTLQDYVYFAEQFPANQPDKRQAIGQLRYSLVRNAIRAARRIPDEPRNNPLWWIQQAHDNRWNSKQLEKAVQQYFGKRTVSPAEGSPRRQSAPALIKSDRKSVVVNQSTFLSQMTALTEPEAHLVENSQSPMQLLLASDPRMGRAVQVAEAQLRQADQELTTLQERITQFNQHFAPFLG